MSITRRRKKKLTGPDVKPRAGKPPEVEGTPITDYQRAGVCAVLVDEPEQERHYCGHYVFVTPHGSACSRGHGGGPVVDTEEHRRISRALMAEGKVPNRINEIAVPDYSQTKHAKQSATSKAIVERQPGEQHTPREITSRPAGKFDVREGDRLTIMYNGAKLSIAAYSTVDLDGAIMSRTLREGDDVQEQWDHFYGKIKNLALKGAKEKLATFADEHAKAKERAKG